MSKRVVIPFLLAVSVYIGSLLVSSFGAGPIGNAQRMPGTSLSFEASNDTGYAGTQACRSCHQAIYDSFISTAHDRASDTATADNIKGRFDTGYNCFKFNELFSVFMVRKGAHYFQSGRMQDAEYRVEPIDIVVGSGRKGQTYLYWKDSLLLQDPISYYTPTNCWCNSPGYPRNGPYFDRITNARCLECHGSAAPVLDGSTYDVAYFQKQSILYGISCERCHGPARAHVLFHTEHPGKRQLITY